MHKGVASNSFVEKEPVVIAVAWLVMVVGGHTCVGAINDLWYAVG